MLRNDGDYVIYIIQHRAGHEWVNSIYGTPNNNFNANGECWQKTGINGVFDLAQGIAGLKQAYANMLDDVASGSRQIPLEFRLAKIEITQKTSRAV